MASRSHAKKTHARARGHAHANDVDDGESPKKGGPGRGTWTGSLSFGLLQIPVTLYPAESRAEEIHFRMLDKHDLSPVRYERVSSSTGKPVEWKDIVKGYEYEPDTYVVLEPEDLKKANVAKTQTIDIQDFVPRGAIDPAFFETPYYLVPNQRSRKAYVLLREALAKKDAVAVATFVLRTREHLCAVMPVGDALMLEILRFGHELKDVDDMPLPGSKDADAISSRELTMAEQLIDGMMTEWNPAKYKDRYHLDVMKLIEEKAKTGVAKEHHTRVRGTVAHDVVDILDLLKKSVAEKGPKRARARTTKKTRAA